MGHKIILIAVLVVFISLCIFVNIRFPNNRVMKALMDAATIIAVIVGAMELLEFDLKGWLNSLPESAVVTPMTPPAINPTLEGDLPGQNEPQPSNQSGATPIRPQQPDGAPLYHQMLDDPAKSPDWEAIDEPTGASGYDGRGYYIVSRTGGVDRSMVSKNGEYGDFALDLFVTPLSDELLTTVFVIFDAEPGGGGGYYYVVAPGGNCSLGYVAGSGFVAMDNQPICPPMEMDKNYRMRLEVDSGMLRVFIDDSFIKEYSLPYYDGGYIGLGVYNSAPEGSSVEAKVRFSNLTIWSLDD